MHWYKVEPDTEDKSPLTHFHVLNAQWSAQYKNLENAASELFQSILEMNTHRFIHVYVKLFDQIVSIDVRECDSIGEVRENEEYYISYMRRAQQTPTEPRTSRNNFKE